MGLLLEQMFVSLPRAYISLKAVSKEAISHLSAGSHEEFRCKRNSVTFNSYVCDCTLNTTSLPNYSSLVFFSPNNWSHYSPM